MEKVKGIDQEGEISEEEMDLEPDPEMSSMAMYPTPEPPTPEPTPEPLATKEPEPMPVIPAHDEETVASTKAAVQHRATEDNELLEHIAGFGTDRGYEVRVYRTSPKKWKGVAIEGHLGTFDEWMSEEDLKQLFGGGTLQLKIHRPNAKGSMQYLKAVSVKLPGPPRGEGIEDDEPAILYEAPSNHEDNTIAQQAMDTMKEMVDKAEKGGNGFDPVMMNLMMEPLKAQIEQSNANLIAMQENMAKKDAQILQLITTKPDTSGQDNLVNKMLDTETGRSEHLRNMHESEMRQLRENSKEESKRQDDRHRDEQRRSEDIQRREIDNMTRSNTTMMDTLKMSYDSRIEGYKKDIERLERDLNNKETELVVLRAKKDKTIIEQVSEIQTIKEAFGAISGSGDDGPEQKWYEKLASTVVDNPEGIASAVAMVTGQNPQQQLQQQPQQQLQQQLAAPPAQGDAPLTPEDIPIGHPFRAEDGQLYCRVPPDGSVVPYDQAVRMGEAAQAREDEAAGKPDPSDVKMAINFMESAFTAGTSAADFAASAKSMIPQNIIKYMESVGVDTFLNEVAVLEQGSVLRNQTGRTYMREVAKFLLEGIPS
jgi:hypothetical protein